MLLRKYKGDHYKCIEDSGEINVHEKITRFVGQNEAGKTALLELLNTLRPISGITQTFVLEDYPRSKLSHYKKVHETTPHEPVSAEFELEDHDVEAIEKEFGSKVLNSKILTLSKKYGNSACFFQLDVNEQAFVKHFLSNLDLDTESKEILKKTKTIKDLQAEVTKLNDETQALFKTLPSSLTKAIYNKLAVPYFFYFDEYAALPGEISLKKLKDFSVAEKYSGNDAESLRTALALINFAGAEVDEFLNQANYERLRADLEAASNAITDQLRKYWTTNKNLEIRFELQPKLNDQKTLIDTTLHIRVYNTKHRVTVPFHKRSKGFVWFFSFLVAFSEYKDHDDKIILLLDEPGLNLGAVAQRDLMKYFEEQLIPYHQILYTTHSQHMIDPRKLDTVRTVEDEEHSGTKVSNDPFRHTSATLSPLQAALGFDISQSLFVAPNNLLVEGPADLIYLNLATQILQQEGRVGLSDEWTIVPVGGADKVATFVSLLGAHDLNLAVFMDVSNGDQQRHQAIMKSKLMLKHNLITVGSVLGRNEADVEDLFSINGFLNLVNRSYCLSVKISDLDDRSPRLVKRFEAYFVAKGINSGKFNHYKLAYDLMTNPSWMNDVFDAETKTNFEKAIASLNQALAMFANRSVSPGLPVKYLKETTGRLAEATI